MEKEIIELTKKLLREAGIDAGYKGFKYWVAAVIFATKNEEYRMKVIYYNLAKQYRTTEIAVEKSLRYILGNFNLTEYFNADCKFTNSRFLEFLTMRVAEKIIEKSA